MRAFASTALILALAAPAAAAPKSVERRLYSDNIDASSFLWNDWNKFVENYHPNYVGDDDPATAWVEGGTSSGAGEWIRIGVTSLDTTTRIRLRVRNGYQKSKELWKANARAKAVTVRLLPSKVEKKVTLADADGWQEVTIDQPSGPVRSIELAVGSVYEGSKYADLCISDVQVYATSETPDNPAFEKSKLANLMGWRSARIAAAKAFAARKQELPIYPAYETKQTEWDPNGPTMYPERASLLETAMKDPVLAKEWKDALAAAAALEKNLASMTRAQLAPASPAKLVEGDGIQIAGIYDLMSGEGAYPRSDAIRLPMLGLVSVLFADQLRLLDVKDAQTIPQYEKSGRSCGSDTVWVSRRKPKEGPARVTAIAVGRCAKLEGRSGSYIQRMVELLVYDASGKLVLLVGEGYLDAYRWTVDGGKPMLEGGRSMLWESGIVDARRRAAV
ncbi:MAG TPA: hypothetical protein VK932_09975, partial [Kofleriaceae bacterium]|nr:hypothetical protein [Kofleriaceae bacterium]